MTPGEEIIFTVIGRTQVEIEEKIMDVLAGFVRTPVAWRWTWSAVPLVETYQSTTPVLWEATCTAVRP